MPLNAEKARGDDQAGDSSLRWTFYAASAGDTESLGAAFARAVLPRAGKESGGLRIGLASGSTAYLGKSTFVKGMLGTLQSRKPLETAFSEGAQNVWYSPEAGWIRHYDCGYGWPGAALPSYWNNDKTGYGLPLTDIVEHPHIDRHNREFDCLVFFSREPMSQVRRITVAATPELAAKPGFQEFLAESAPMREKPKPRTHWALDL